MKKKLLKVIGISFLIYVILSWIIPVGTYSSGELTTNGIDPVGLIDLFNTPINAFITFILYGVVFVTIGGLYGVMEKTGALEKVTDSMGRAFKGKERGFLRIFNSNSYFICCTFFFNRINFTIICLSTFICGCTFCNEL